VAAPFACDDSEHCEHDSDEVRGAPQVRLGHGVSDFNELPESGATIPIVRGFQGGFMLPMSLQMSGLRPGNPCDDRDTFNPLVVYRASLVESDAELGEAIRTKGFSHGEIEDFELIGTWFIFDLSLRSEEFLDKMIRMEVEVTDTDGRTARDAAVVRVVDSP
jgi:hypothetical protein